MSRMRELRQAKGMTQQELAASAHLAMSTVVEVEAGRTKPRIDTAQAIAAALGAKIDDIWPFDPEQNEVSA